MEKKGFYEVIVAIAIDRYVNWSDIVASVIRKKGRFSTTTIRRRLEDMVTSNLVEKRIKIESRDEYTYHATAKAIQYAKAIQEMKEKTE